MLSNIENHKKVYIVHSTRSDRDYHIVIFKEKKQNVYRIINLTLGYICPCTFDTYEQAEDDIYKYQMEGKNKILDIYSLSL